MGVIFRTPAFCATVTDSQSKSAAHVQNWNMLLNPRDIRAKYLLDLGNDGERPIQERTP